MPKDVTISTEPFNQTTREARIDFRLDGESGPIAKRLFVDIAGRVELSDGTVLRKEAFGLVKDITTLTAEEKTTLVDLLRKLWKAYRKDVSDD